MPKVKKNSASVNATAANVGYEAELWQMADALRGSMDAAEYKHVVLGLIFLKYISDTTWRLAKMNLAIRGIDGQIGYGDTFHNDRHPDLKADFILANPPFNISDWGGERLRDDKRWQSGVPPAGNANYAWVQHMVHHDARKLGRMADRTHRELTDEDVARIANTYHAWREEKDAGEYADVAGFCRARRWRKKGASNTISSFSASNPGRA